MFKKVVFSTCLLLAWVSYAQQIEVTDENSYTSFVEQLSNSKDLKYQEILSRYDDYLKSNPNDILVQLYRCKFIGQAYYDEYEDYDPNYEETESCLDDLQQKYPNHPAVMLYKLENTYGDDRLTYFKEVMLSYDDDYSDWSNSLAADLFEIGAYDIPEEEDVKAIRYAEKAMTLNDSLDLSVLISNAYVRMGQEDKAKEVLLSNLNRNIDTWTLSQKGKLLIELGENDRALELFDQVEKIDSSYSNNESLYTIFLESEKYEEARTFILKDTASGWNRERNLQRLMTHDMEYSDPSTALSSYRLMQKQSYYDDILGIKRWQLFFKAPGKSWNLNELSHLPVFFLLILVLFLMPYLWVLPVKALGDFMRKKKMTITSILPHHWGLKHFWLISFVYLFAQILLVLIFYYQDTINSLFDVAYSYLDDTFIEDDRTIANSLVAFTGISFVLTMLFLNLKRLVYVFHSNSGVVKMLVQSIGFVFVNGIILRLLGNFVDLTEAMSYVHALNMKAEITALMGEFGFGVTVLLVAVLVPIYEEVIFRGVILNSVEKHIGFFKANIFQASLFSIAHGSLQLFIFYFFFGMVLGYAVKRTEGLLTGIIFHIMNNFLVTLALYYASTLVVG